MLIRQAQIAAMDLTVEKNFLIRIERFVADAYDVDLHDAEVIDRCKTLVRSARSYNFRTELEIATFVSCGFAYGMNFDEDLELPFAKILRDAELDVEFKAERMAAVLDEDPDYQPEESSQI